MRDRILLGLCLPLAAAAAVAPSAPPGWAEALLEERAGTIALMRDGLKSPYAAVVRKDFEGSRPVVLGSAADADQVLEGLSPHHLRLRVEGESFILEAIDPGAAFRVQRKDGPRPAPEAREARVPAGTPVEVGRYALRLSHQNFPAFLVLDPKSARLADGPAPRWFPPDPAFRVIATLVREEKPREVIVLSTRGNKRRALQLGRLEFELQGRKLHLSALRLLEPGADEAGFSLFFQDATTGQETYPVGRYLEPEPVPGEPDHWLVDFNRAYNPTCAFSPHYNCPIPPRGNKLELPVRAGELKPAGH